MIPEKANWFVTPAKAGVQTASRRKSGTSRKDWIPAFAGMIKFYGISDFFETMHIFGKQK